MGYMTRYQLEWDKSPTKSVPCEHCGGKGKTLIGDAVQRFVDEEQVLYGGTETLSSVLDDSCKWYEHEEDMKRVSKEFPETVFTLHGSGEESGDVWVKYFKNGKMQVSKAEIKLATFDPKKLK